MSSSTPTRQITAAATSTARESCWTVAWLAEERQLPGQQDGGGHPGQHGHAAEVGHLDGVHVPVADLGQRAGSQGEPAAQPAGQVGDGRGDRAGPAGTRALSSPTLGQSCHRVDDCRVRHCAQSAGTSAGSSRSATVRAGRDCPARAMRPRRRRSASSPMIVSSGSDPPSVIGSAVRSTRSGRVSRSVGHAERPVAQHLPVVGRGEVDDGRRRAGPGAERPAVEVHRDPVAELLDGLRRRSARPAGRRCWRC